MPHQSTGTGQIGQPEEYKLACPDLPLAVYREIAVCLRQVEGVDAGLAPQQSEQFDYNQSQVSGLSIRYAADLNPKSQAQVEAILAYYSSRFGSWSKGSID